MELGVVGSAIGIASFAIQLGDGIFKLKSFWDSVKDAPEEIFHILDELDTMQVVVAEIEEGLGGNTASPAAVKSLQLCKKGMRILNDVMNEMEREMQSKRKWACVKVVLKREFLEKMEKRLERANMLLMMSHHSCIASLSKSRHDEQVKLAMLQFTQIVDVRTILQTVNSAKTTSTIQCQTSINNTSNASTTKDATSISSATNALSKHRKILNAKLRLPFFSGVWELCGYRQSTSGWAFTLRTYNVVSEDAPIIKLVEGGDIVGMQQLFETRQASPFDVDPFGRTLLHQAAYMLEYETCQFLIDQGADPNAEDNYGRFAWGDCLRTSLTAQNASETMRYLVSRTDCDIIDELSTSPSIQAFGLYFPFEIFRWLLHSSENPIHERSHRERAIIMLVVARSISSGNCILTRDIKSFVSSALAGMDMQTCVRNLNQLEYSELLESTLYGFPQFLLRALGLQNKLADTNVNGMLKITFDDGDDVGISDKDCLKDILGLIDDIIFAGSKVHHFGTTYEGYRHSLHDQIISGVLDYMNLRDPLYQEGNGGVFEPIVRCAIGMWLNRLASAGIDLIEYGQWEKRVYDYDRIYSYFFGERRGGYLIQTLYWRLISFTYGPKKSDWQLWFTLEDKWMCEGGLAEFWDMVEHPERQMPGAWNF
ncbi:hypothetical protein EAF04_008820 [Stromatinia cepivora]|nr:hypothetical protein EAF04_008820 [Stromatinia cepivora]